MQAVQRAIYMHELVREGGWNYLFVCFAGATSTGRADLQDVDEALRRGTWRTTSVSSGDLSDTYTYPCLIVVLSKVPTLSSWC